MAMPRFIVRWHPATHEGMYGAWSVWDSTTGETVMAFPINDVSDLIEMERARKEAALDAARRNEDGDVEP